MKKLALPLVNNQLSLHFENCTEFIIFTIQDEKCIVKELKMTHVQSGIFPHYLAKIGVTDVIVKSIGINTAIKLNKFKINVFAGVEHYDPEQLLKEFLSGSLETKAILEMI